MGGYDSVSPIVAIWNSNALPNDAASESEVKSKYNFQRQRLYAEQEGGRQLQQKVLKGCKFVAMKETRSPNLVPQARVNIGILNFPPETPFAGL